MSEQITIKQHYVPQSLLLYFTNLDEKLFEVLLREKKIYRTNTLNSMCENFTYEHEKLPVNTIEKYLSKIEDRVAGQVKNLIQVIEEIKSGKMGLSAAKVIVENTLHDFLLFYYRSGALLTEFSSFKKEEKIPLMSDKILNHEYLDKLAGVIKDFYNFAIIESSGDFLISDQFISTSALKIKTQFFHISNRHIGLKETLILIPISSRYYIAYWNTERDFFLKKDTINLLNEDNVRQINDTIINNSYIKCAGMKKEKIEEILPEFNESSPTQIFAGGNPKNFSMGAIKKKEVFFYEDEKEVWNLFKLHTSIDYKNLGVYDLCKCGSGKKFKWCHFNSYKRVEEIWSTFGIPEREAIIKFYIWGVPIIEQPIDSWSGYSKDDKKPLDLPIK
jgi:uncharacterized protein YchJ